MEERYQGRWDDHMMADYCWNLMRDCSGTKHRGKSYTCRICVDKMLPQFFSSYATKTAAGRLSYDSVFPRTQLLKVRVVIKPDSEFDSLAETNFCCTTTYCQ